MPILEAQTKSTNMPLSSTKSSECVDDISVRSKLEIESDSESTLETENKTHSSESFNEMRDEIQTDTEVKAFPCSHCAKAFRDKNSFTRHMKTHAVSFLSQPEDPFLCAECNKGFSKKAELRRHMVVHSGEKHFQCGECDKSFTCGSNLSRHKRLHDVVEKSFSCQLCEKDFREESALLKHGKTHTNKKSFFL